MNDTTDNPTVTVGRPLTHDSAALHVSGQARYIDDLPEPRGLLHSALGLSRKAHARIKSIDLSEVLAAPGVVTVLTVADIPGLNNYGGVVLDDPILVDDVVEHVGQPLFVVAADTLLHARRAALLARVEYEDLAPLLTIESALAHAEARVLPTERLQRGDVPAALASAPHRLKGRFRIGGQEQFYLESHIALALPQEGGAMQVYSSTQHPGEVQHVVARALAVPDHAVVVECRRMGGGFGGKETQSALFACIAALLARKTGQAVKLRPDRDTDMIVTGKRHDFLVDYEVGFDDDGRIQGVDFLLAGRCGRSADLSGPVNDRAMLHADNAYFLENVQIVSHRVKTHTVSNTAFRGFGGPQGMMAIEQVIDEIARYLRCDPLAVRKVNFYGTTERNVTHYGMTIEDNSLPELIAELESSADYQARRQDIAQFNANSPFLKRGIALTPVKFGISFTATHLNQAGALLHLYTDGSIYLNHGGTEMGQGLYTKVAQIVAEELGVAVARVKMSAADTSKVPNASATAASSGTDLNGMAAQAAARTLKERLTAFAAERFQVSPEQISFADDQVVIGAQRLKFGELVKLAWLARVPLSATGFYKTPKIGYDRSRFWGRPFLYFVYGAAVAEVIIDTLTGEYKVLRADILHDVGRSINPALDIGQIEGGFLQGAGWLTCEELWWNAQGELMTHAPSTYKIPACSDWPVDVTVRLLANAANREPTIHRSKAVGEPPLMLAMSVFYALKEAVASVGGYTLSPKLDAPATPEAVLRAVQELQARLATAETAAVAVL